jgi:hypothetical protein
VLATLTAKDSANTIRQLIQLQLEQVGARLALPFLPRPEDQTAVVVTRTEDDAFGTAVDPETVRTTSAVHPS